MVHSYPTCFPLMGAVTDNCSIHHADSVKELFRQASVLLTFLPPYSPDPNPIELAFVKVKRYLKENDALLQVVPDPLPITKVGFNTISKTDCNNWSVDCGYGK